MCCRPSRFEIGNCASKKYADCLLHAIAGKRLGDFCIDGLGGRQVVIAASYSLLVLGHAAAVQRAGKPRVKLERCIEVGGGLVEVAGFKIGEAAAVERVGIVWLEPQRLVAVLERLLQLPGDGARPAA